MNRIRGGLVYAIRVADITIVRIGFIDTRISHNQVLCNEDNSHISNVNILLQFL